MARRALLSASIDGTQLTAPSAFGFGKTRSPMRHMLRFVDGGVETFLAVLRLSPDEAMQRVATSYEALSKEDRKKVRLEELLEVCEVEPSSAIAEFSRVAYEHGADLARAIAGLAQPAIMAASAKVAATALGDPGAERRMHFSATRFTPTPKSAVVVNQNNVQQNTVKIPELPDFLDEQRARATMLREQASTAIDGEVI